MLTQPSISMNLYVNAAKHLDEAECSNHEDQAPIQQQKTMADDIVFRSRENIGMHAPTDDPLVITANIGPALVHNVDR